MTDALMPLGDGHTGLSEDDRRGLIPPYIATRRELFEAEQRNITEGVRGRHPTATELVDDKYLRELHRAMFDKVWKWAGTYRRRETNIGIDVADISVAMLELVRDVNTWVEFEAFSPDKLAIRFHHRLVAIHPFPNGNGRHGRIASDLLVTALAEKPFTWGAGLAVSTDELRQRYIAALRHSDEGDIAELIEFARS